jgi:hypothetical protein
MPKQKIASKDRAELRRLVEVYGRKLVEREVVASADKPPRNAGRKSYVGGGEDVWLQFMSHKQQMETRGSIAAKRASSVARSMVKEDPALGLSAKSVENTVAKVNAKRERDPQYKAQTDWLLAPSWFDWRRISMSGVKIVAGRLKSDGSTRPVKLSNKPSQK